MKQFYYSLILILVFSSCVFKNQTFDNVNGKYINTFEPRAEHYVILKDSTFSHYYRGDLGTFTQSGKLGKKVDQNILEVTFDYWINFGQLDTIDCKHGCLWSVKLVNNELLFNYDSRDRYNFVKVD